MNAHQRRVARRKACKSPVSDLYDYGDDYWDDDEWQDPICDACSGTSGDPMNDGITPCDVCEGEGTKWWL